MIKLKPDVLVAAEASPAMILHRIGSNLPIVCLTFTDALIPGLAANYAHPGGSVTGFATSVEGVTEKLVELALEIVPGAKRIGFLSNPTGASMQVFLQHIGAGASARGVTVLTEQAATRDELPLAFKRLASEKPGAVIVPANGLFRSNRAQIAYLGLAEHVPTIADQRLYVEAGVLASYGVDEKENYRRAAGYVAKLLKGAKAGELPIEFPSNIELAVNLRAARALGLVMPTSLLARADEVIE